MKRLAIAIAAIALIGTSAFAADLNKPVYKAPPPPPLAPVYNWTGWYVGGNVGGHWGTDKITTTTQSGGGFTVAGAAAVDAASPTSLHPDGVIGGVQAGYNWQVNTYLLGLEADADWLGGTASRTLTGIPVVATGDFMTNSSKATFLATVRPRIGVVFDRALFYATGGLAVGTVKTSDLFAGFGGTVFKTTSDTNTRTGWTVGGGLEYAFVNNWSAKVEYLFVDLGSFDTVIPNSPAGAPDSHTVHHKYTDNILRVGLNYQFH
jgi:outer membrane immunogenic protein